MQVQFVQTVYHFFNFGKILTSSIEWFKYRPLQSCPKGFAALVPVRQERTKGKEVRGVGICGGAGC